MSQANSPEYTSLEATSGDQLVELFRSQIRELYDFATNPLPDHQRFTAARAALEQAPRRIAEYIARESEFLFLPPADDRKFYSDALLESPDSAARIAKAQEADDFSFKPGCSMVSIQRDGTIVLGNAGSTEVLAGNIGAQHCAALLNAMEVLSRMLISCLDRQRQVAGPTKLLTDRQPAPPSAVSSEPQALIETAAIDPEFLADVRSAQRPDDLPPELACYATKLPGIIFDWCTIGGNVLPQLKASGIPKREGQSGGGGYRFPAGSAMVLGVPVGHHDRVLDPTRLLLIVEGTKQYRAVASAVARADLPWAVVGISGCWGWKTDRKPIPCLSKLPLKGRQVVVLFDGDVRTNPSVHDAAKALSELLLKRFVASSVRFALMPPNGTDGVDDLLADSPADDRGDIIKALIEKAPKRLPARPSKQSSASPPVALPGLPPANENGSSCSNSFSGIDPENTKAELQEFLKQKHLLRFNELTGLVEIDSQPMKELDLADSFLAALHRIEVGKQAARDSFVYIARSNPYNPIEEYLEGLRQRTDLHLLNIEVICAAFGIAANDTLSQELLARQLVGAVKRGLHPGHKHDCIVIFVGPQGGGKSTAIAALAPDGMSDSATRVPKALEDREFLTKINRSWIFEFDEIDKIMQGREASEFKGFASRREDVFVQKWESQAQEHPRRCVLFGTTNHSEVLNDHTGDRRVWVIPVTSCDPAWIRQHRDLIWGSVLTWADWGLENWIPPNHPSVLAAAERAREARISEPWEGVLREQLERLPAPLAGIAQDALIQQALRAQIKEVTRDVQCRVTRCITADGFTTHEEGYRWIQKKSRYCGGPPRSGYLPVPILPATPQPVPADSGGGRQHQMPWQDSRLTALFQPFRPFIEEEEESEWGRDAHGDSTHTHRHHQTMGQNVATRRNGAEIPGPDSDLVFRTGSEQGPEPQAQTTERPAAAPLPQAPSLPTATRLPEATPPGAPSATTTPAARPSPSDATLTCRERVEKALVELKAGPECVGIVQLLRPRLPGIPRARIEAVVQELIREKREAEQPDLLGS